MRKISAAAVAMGLAALLSAQPASAQYGMDKKKPAGTPELPQCAKPLGRAAIREPERDWWTGLGLSNPESLIKLFASRSNCLRIVDRNGGLAMRNEEAALGASGDLRRGSNIGKGQVAGADFFIVERRDPESARATVIELVTSRIPDRFGLDPVRDIQVLTPMNRGPAGAVALNQALQAALNPAGVALVRGARTFRVGDKVMQLRNDYDKGVYNGDVGLVASIDPEEVAMTVRFDGRHVAFEASDLDDLVLAYACTVHKSQGSEYPAVVIPLLTTHFVMLSKNLLYTAVTRGKRLVVLVCDRRALTLALSTGRAAGDGQRRGGDEARRTRLALRLRERLAAT